MRFADFVIVEFARAWQEEQGASVVDPAIVQQVRAADGFDPDQPEDALVRYADALLDARVPTEEGRRAPRQLRLAWQALAWIAPAIGVLLGAGFVAATLPSEGGRTVNLFAVMAEGVVVPLVFGAVTLAATLGGGERLASAHWAAWVIAAAQRPLLETKLGGLAGRTLRRSGVAGPLLAGLSHRLWVGLLVGFLALAGWRLTFEDHRFSWGSTGPLTAEGVESTFDLLAAPVAWLPGVDAPTPEQVAVSEWDSLRGRYARSSGDPATDEALRKGWYGLVLAAIAAWGLLPRLLALALGQWAIVRGIRRALAAPGHAAAVEALVRPAVTVSKRAALGEGTPARVEEPSAAETEESAAADSTDASPVAEGAPAAEVDGPRYGLDLVLFATEPPAEADLEGAGLTRLGLSGRSWPIEDDADDDGVDAVLAALDGPEAPEGAVVVFRCADTPDRLRAGFLADVAGALGAERLHVLLTGVEAFAAGPRGARLDDRLAGWAAVAEAAGVAADRVVRDDGRPS